MGHVAFTTLADRAVHVLGQLQHFDQICKLLHGDLKCYNKVVMSIPGDSEPVFRKRRTGDGFHPGLLHSAEPGGL